MPAQQCLWLNDEERLSPRPNHSCQEDEEHPIRFRAGRPFHLPFEDDQLLSSEGIFRHQFGLASAKVGEGLERQGRSGRFCPLKTTSTEGLHRRTYELPETSQNHSEFLLEEDASLYKLQCEYIPTPLNFTPVAPPSATGQESRYRSPCGFFRTDVPSSQYTQLITRRGFLIGGCRITDIW